MMPPERPGLSVFWVVPEIRHLLNAFPGGLPIGPIGGVFPNDIVPKQSHAMENSDVVIIGGGIVGLATGLRLTREKPGLKVIVLEKEATPGHHQTGHNSGVLHSGIYYKPGSLKAVNCREGRKAMIEFCADEGIDHEICGKVIVATSEDELPALDRIFQRGQENGIKCETIEKERLKELEPHAAGVRAIHVPEAGIVNFSRVCDRLAERISDREGNRVVYKAEVRSIQEKGDAIILETRAGEFETRFLVNCAGLQSDRVTAMGGQKPNVKIVPFRGEYYKLTSEAHTLVKNLIYPVPDPAFPFLGVHFTRMIEGGIECGPNAVLAFAREGYGKTNINLRDLAETLTYPGFLKLASRFWRIGAGEMLRSYSKPAFVRALRRLVPGIRAEHLEPAPAGVRAQAVAPDGAMVDDFMIQESRRVVNVCNAPSPAATAALNIGNIIVDKLKTHF